MQLDLTIEQINVILQSLAAQPYQAVAPLIAVIQQQVRPQIENQQPAETLTEESTDG